MIYTEGSLLRGYSNCGRCKNVLQKYKNNNGIFIVV
jgi:hypothetical protein